MQIYECVSVFVFPLIWGTFLKYPLLSGPQRWSILCHLVPELLPVLGVPVTFADWFAGVDSFVLINTSLVGGQCCWLKVADAAARQPGPVQQSSRAMAGLLMPGRICGPQFSCVTGSAHSPTEQQGPPHICLLCQHVREAGCSGHTLFSSAGCLRTARASSFPVVPRTLSSVGAEHQGSLELHD